MLVPVLPSYEYVWCNVFYDRPFCHCMVRAALFPLGHVSFEYACTVCCVLFVVVVVLLLLHCYCLSAVVILYSVVVLFVVAVHFKITLYYCVISQGWKKK